MGLKLLLLLVSFNVYAIDCNKSDFDKQYYPKTEIENTKIFCYEQYVLDYNFSNKSAIWVGEHLYPGEKLIKTRKNSFKPNTEIPLEYRTTLKDYLHSGYDKGHLASSADMVTQSSQQESFLLSNMIPQNKDHNRGIWKELEYDLRELSKQKELIIISGPIYSTEDKVIGNNVKVPKALFKYIHNISDHIEYGFIIPNNDNFTNLKDYKVDKEEIQLITNIKF
jgi:endonuclease G